MSFEQKHVNYAGSHVKGQVRGKHCDEPVARVNVDWNFVFVQVSAQNGKVDLREGLQLETKNSESRVEIEHFSEFVVKQQ